MTDRSDVDVVESAIFSNSIDARGRFNSKILSVALDLNDGLVARGGRVGACVLLKFARIICADSVSVLSVSGLFFSIQRHLRLVNMIVFVKKSRYIDVPFHINSLGNYCNTLRLL